MSLQNMRANVRLRGKQVEKFARARTALEDDTNLSRMRRQRDYLDSSQKCARDAINADAGFAVEMLEKMSD